MTHIYPVEITVAEAQVGYLLRSISNTLQYDGGPIIQLSDPEYNWSLVISDISDEINGHRTITINKSAGIPRRDEIIAEAHLDCRRALVVGRLA